MRAASWWRGRRRPGSHVVDRRGHIPGQGGIHVYDLEQELNRTGQELRFFPSTWRSATLGGFARSTTGCGAIGHGTLHTPGNVLALKILTAGDTPP
jgi:FAD/FMN-containing dehydrogenase